MLFNSKSIFCKNKYKFSQKKHIKFLSFMVKCIVRFAVHICAAHALLYFSQMEEN